MLPQSHIEAKAEWRMQNEEGDADVAQKRLKARTFPWKASALAIAFRRIAARVRTFAGLTSGLAGPRLRPSL
jgi:hypothetical protein